MIEGISHITFIVKDIERTSEFLKGVFDAEEVYSSGDEQFSLLRERFFLIGGTWIAVMEGESRLDKTYDHVAFKITEEDFEKYAARIETFGLEILPGRPRVAGEGSSLYFYDYDNHLFELHTGTLQERLDRYTQGR